MGEKTERRDQRRRESDWRDRGGGWERGELRRGEREERERERH